MRALSICVIGAAAIMLACSRADAITELCPATATPLRALDAVAPATAATTFSYDLYSLSPETVSGTLAVQTDGGWYEIPFGPVALVEHDERYTIWDTNFTRRNYYSAPLYARFPMAVDTKYQFVSKISTDDTMFAWPTTKDMQCEWEGAPLDLPRAHHTKYDAFELPEHPALLASPAPSSPVPIAVKSSELNALSCAVPFRPSASVHHVQAEYPAAAADSVHKVNVSVVVALDDKGAVTDDWLFAPSSIGLLNDSTLKAAEASTYVPGISRCRAVPTLYIFYAGFAGYGTN